MTFPLLDWCSANPWLTFWCAWPIASTLIAAAWFAAEVLTRGMNTLVYIANLLSNTLVISLRGYAPQSQEAHPEDRGGDDTPTGTT